MPTEPASAASPPAPAKPSSQASPKPLPHWYWIGADVDGIDMPVSEATVVEAYKSWLQVRSNHAQQVVRRARRRQDPARREIVTARARYVWR